MSEEMIAGLGRCLVTGAGTALGRQVVRELSGRGVRVRVLGSRGAASVPQGVELLGGVECDGAGLEKACGGVASVFHCEPTRPSREGADTAAADADALIRAGRATGVSRIVYASGHGSGLCESEIGAEARIRAASGEGLATCVVRAGAVWNAEEGGLLDDLVALMASGWYVARPRAGELRTELTSVEHLSDAMIAAGQRLVTNASDAGRVYSVIDGVAVDPLDHFEPLLRDLGFEPPERRISASWLIAWARAWQRLHGLHLATAPPVGADFWRLLAHSRLENSDTVEATRRDLGTARNDRGELDHALALRCAERSLESWSRMRRERISRRFSLPFFIRLPNLRRTLAVITALHRWFYLATAGRIGHVLGATTFLLVDNVGRRSGRSYRTPLLYVSDGPRFVVAASNAGDARLPAWWLNLKASPNASVRVGNRFIHVRARVADAEESEKLWPMMIASYRWFRGYRENLGREIPLVLLEPTIREPTA